MRRAGYHHHPCQDCGAKTVCPGEWEENYDGIPEVICREFHQDGGINFDFVCADCDAQRMAQADADAAADERDDESGEAA